MGCAAEAAQNQHERLPPQKVLTMHECFLCTQTACAVQHSYEVVISVMLSSKHTEYTCTGSARKPVMMMHYAVVMPLATRRAHHTGKHGL